MLQAGLFDFKRQYCQYAEYHNDKTNQAIHSVFVPTILFTSYAMVATYNPSIMWAVAAGYSTYYTILQPVIGGSAGVLVMLGAAGAHAFALNGEAWLGVNPFTVALGVHAFSWIAQFYGHGVHERRAPALLDNLLQAVVLAPLFVWSHAIFDLGFMPKLHKELQDETDKRVAAFKAKK
ncbi:hypothetical protein CcCBS67573_g09086 [Chytriomyces confervae]|uniref:DUF962 domain-containing protein n=1 Tax=Chytriomyces confervae TaxID=246404 RepID=A0A507E5W2_9FUNG|nr:hypothetical protein CcCBS67573_g09086 [Chytriomyces confervae]